MKLANYILLVLMLRMHETITKFLHASSWCCTSLSTRITVHQPTPWSSVILEKLAGKSRNSPHCMEPEDSCPHSQEPHTCILSLVTLFPPTGCRMIRHFIDLSEEVPSCFSLSCIPLKFTCYVLRSG